MFYTCPPNEFIPGQPLHNGLPNHNNAPTPGPSQTTVPPFINQTATVNGNNPIYFPTGIMNPFAPTTIPLYSGSPLSMYPPQPHSGYPFLYTPLIYPALPTGYSSNSMPQYLVIPERDSLDPRQKVGLYGPPTDNMPYYPSLTSAFSTMSLGDGTLPPTPGHLVSSLGPYSYQMRPHPVLPYQQSVLPCSSTGATNSSTTVFQPERSLSSPRSSSTSSFNHQQSANRKPNGARNNTNGGGRQSHNNTSHKKIPYSGIPVGQPIYGVNGTSAHNGTLLIRGRFFVIKSYSEDDVVRSIQHRIWCSTDHGNHRLDQAFRESPGVPIILFFSVNGSGKFCGVAQMVSSVDHTKRSGVWSQDKWRGEFHVNWLLIRDVPNSALRHIWVDEQPGIPMSESRPVTKSRDATEIPPDKANVLLASMYHYSPATTSLCLTENGSNRRRSIPSESIARNGGSTTNINRSHSTRQFHNQ